MNYRRYKDKGVQIHKNQEQGFLLERQVRNIVMGALSRKKSLMHLNT